MYFNYMHEYIGSIYSAFEASAHTIVLTRHAPIAVAGPPRTDRCSTTHYAIQANACVHESLLSLGI